MEGLSVLVREGREGMVSGGKAGRWKRIELGGVAIVCRIVRVCLPSFAVLL